MFEISSKVTIKTPEWVSDVFQVSLLLILLWFLHFDFDQVTDQVSFIMIFYVAVIWKYSKILKKSTEYSRIHRTWNLAKNCY